MSPPPPPLFEPQLPPDIVIAGAWPAGSLSRAIESVLPEILASMPLSVTAIDTHGNFQVWNRAAERLFGWSAAEVLGGPLPATPPEGKEAYDSLRTSAATKAVAGKHLVRVRKDGSRVEVRLWTCRIVDSTGALLGVLGVMTDETERKAHERELSRKNAELALLKEVAMVANESEALLPALRRCLRLIGDHTSTALGHALVLNPDTGVLESALWHTPPSGVYESFQLCTESTRFSRGVGLPGEVLATGTAAWCGDMTTDGTLPRSGAARQSGLRGGFAFPLLVRAEVVAVLEFFSDQALSPDENLRSLAVQLGTQLGRVVERSRAEQQRQELTQKAQSAREEAANVRRNLILARVSAREREVLGHLSAGSDNLKIAAHLGISERTVKAHISALFKKLEVENRTQLAILALDLGLRASG